ncbi:unnamed protein product [Linum tenue]|uniref:Chalcone isomerase domain-containing protein n=1 Tax=Linum tenue TaxID=586396 RepID=A0AAV0MQF9_9ROSI|nr:unnamed protein product [Linum tenue]
MHDIEPQGCSICSCPDLNWKKHAVEPITGIEFPIVLDSSSTQEKKSSLAPEILVGTGSRTMKIIKIKSLKVYAFGFYVHPNSLCEKLGWKYASNQVYELDKRHDFYQDLLREDIGMTVRLVINCNGMKINTVRDAFEKSLRARLLKGTTVDFRRTADGHLITEIEGNHIGAIQSKELCRAFFDMYIGDVPVSEQAKEDIGKNVASIIRKC